MLQCPPFLILEESIVRFAKLQLPHLLAPYVKTHAEAQRG